MTDRELMQMVLDALSNFDKGNHGMRWQVPIIKALRARLTQPDRNFQFSTIEEAMQPMHPMPAGQPQLTDDETKFANAFTTLIKAGYGKEAEIVLKCKREWVGLTDQEQSDIAWQKDMSRLWIVTATEAKLKEKNG